MEKRDLMMNETERKPKANIVKKVFGIVMNVILGFIIIIGIAISIMSLSARSNDGVADIFGTSPLIVLSDSMKGTFSKGDLIFIKKVNFTSQGMPSIEFKENETIATFKYDVDGDDNIDIVTHLFIGKTEYGAYMFQGTYKGEDGNAELATQVVTPANIIGVYTNTKIKKMGSVLGFLQSSTGFLVCFVVPLFIYFLFTGIKLILVLFEDKSKKQLASANATISAEELEKERERIREEVRRELLEETKKKE